MRLIPEAWPGALQVVARLLGDEAAAAVAKALGGRRLYLPADPAPGHALCRIIGRRAARLVAQQLVAGVGGWISWPTAKTQLNAMEAERLRRAGRSVPSIAQAMHLTERQVSRLVSHIPKGEAAAAEDDDEGAACPCCGHRPRSRAARPVDDRQMPLPLG